MEVMSKSKSNPSSNSVFKKIAVLIMAIFSPATFFFTLRQFYGLNIIQNAFSFFNFDYFLKVDSIGENYINLFSLFFIILFSLAIAAVILAFVNIFLRNGKAIRTLAIIFSLSIPLFYFIIGIWLIAIIATIPNYPTVVETFAYIPLIIQSVLFLIYIVTSKLIKSKLSSARFNSTLLNNSPKTTTDDDIKLLEKLADLKQKNIISEEEFNIKKKEILGL